MEESSGYESDESSNSSSNSANATATTGSVLDDIESQVSESFPENGETTIEFVIEPGAASLLEPRSNDSPIQATVTVPRRCRHYWSNEPTTNSIADLAGALAAMRGTKSDDNIQYT